jgi:hypothetical protein
VHDDGDYQPGPLKAGHVFSIDPQLRVPEENLYIRYEDTVVVTGNGYENFTDFLPAELDDLEKLVRQRGGIVEKMTSQASGPPNRPYRKPRDNTVNRIKWHDGKLTTDPGNTELVTVAAGRS